MISKTIIHTQLTWRCSNCGQKGIGTTNELTHYRKCMAARAKETVKTIDGFIHEVHQKHAELREIDGRYQDFVKGLKK